MPVNVGEWISLAAFCLIVYFLGFVSGRMTSRDMSDKQDDDNDPPSPYVG